MQCIKSSFAHITTLVTKPLSLAFDDLISVVTTRRFAQDFTSLELHFVLMGVVATLLVVVGSTIMFVLANYMAKSVHAIKHIFSGAKATTTSVHSIHVFKHADNGTNSDSFDDSSVDDASTPPSTIINNYTTHIHGPIYNVGAEAVGTLRRMRDLGSTSDRLLEIDEESEDEEDEEQEEMGENDEVAAGEN